MDIFLYIDDVTFNITKIHQYNYIVHYMIAAIIDVSTPNGFRIMHKLIL